MTTRTKNERTAKFLIGCLALLLVAVLGFAVWVTTLLVRAHRGKTEADIAAGRPPEVDDPWKNNPYTTSLPAASGAPSASAKP